MVDEGRARELLGDAGRDVPVGGAPVDALARRGRRSLWQRRAAPVLAVAVVAGVVVGGGGLFGGLGDDAEPSRSDPGLVLSTNDWVPGEGADEALISGRLAITNDGCVHLVADNSRVDVIWPAGYTATREDVGVVVRNTEGRIVAAQGVSVSAGGGGASAAGLECRASESAPFSIQQELEPIDMPSSSAILNTAAEPSDVMEARISAYLYASPDGCVHLRSGPTSSVQDAVFPFGYYADEQDGKVVVRRPDGAVVAREGERFVSSGGTVGPPGGMACRVSEGEVTYPQAMRPLDAEAVDVPDLVGESQWEAEDALADAGLDVGVIYEPSALREGVELSTVVAQDPSVGVTSEPFPRVTLWVAAPDPEPSDSERAMVETFAAFAETPETGSVPFADEVVLGLGDQEARTVPGELLDDHEAWIFREPYAGRSPPFSALDSVPAPDDDYSVRVGPHRHCAGRPIQPSDALAGMRQLSIQPWGSDLDSCLDWYAVDLFLDPGGEIAGVVLDLWEP